MPAFFICLCYLSAISQEIKLGDVVVLKADIPIIQKEVVGISSDLAEKDKILDYLQKGVKFYVVSLSSISSDIVKLRAVNFNSISPEERKSLDKMKIMIKSDYYNDKIYAITSENFKAFAEKVVPEDRISIGIITLPFKARPQEDFSFDTELNLNTTLNIRIGHFLGSSFNYQLGAGIGSVGLNTNNASGIEADDAQDVATLTLFNGLMLQYNNVQVGLYLGIDHINNQKNYNWVSNGNIWLGFGIGYNLFEISVASSKNSQD
ncbi:hypothetical protein [Winogradskyella sp.]|uniref:hypothetical protein n=1 Tax=Winogradskyella sp. TaxID=1883156 RepID=UPI0025E3A9F3|nr:hypothetical protein [Winogradskyella sp.]